MHLLDHADFIIGLDANGTVVENGPREDVTKKQDYLTKLGIEPANDESTPKETPETHKEAEFAPTAAVTDSLQRTVDEATQRLGDGSVYKYYFGTFGWPKTLVFFALQTILVFCLKFPGTHQNHLMESCVLTDDTWQTLFYRGGEKQTMPIPISTMEDTSVSSLLLR